MSRLLFVVFTIFVSTSVNAFEELILNCKYQKTLNHEVYAVAKSAYSNEILKHDREETYRDREDIGLAIKTEGCVFIRHLGMAPYMTSTISENFIKCSFLKYFDLEAEDDEDKRIPLMDRLEYSIDINRNTGKASYRWEHIKEGKRKYDGSFYPETYIDKTLREYQCEVAKKKF